MGGSQERNLTAEVLGIYVLLTFTKVLFCIDQVEVHVDNTSLFFQLLPYVLTNSDISLTIILLGLLCALAQM